MIKDIFNALSGRNRNWNKIRQPYLRKIEERIKNSDVNNTRQFYLPFPFVTIEFVDHLFGPHREINMIMVKTSEIKQLAYEKIFNVSTEGLLQVYLNTTSDPETVKEVMKTSYIISTGKTGLSFEELNIAKYSKANDANFVSICSEMMNKYREILNLEEGDPLEGLNLIPILSTYLHYVHDLRKDGSLDSMFKY